MPCCRVLQIWKVHRKGFEMRKIVYTLSVAAIALTAMTVEASARKDRFYEAGERHHHKIVRHEKKIKYGNNHKKIVKKTVIRKPGGKKIVSRVVTIVKQPGHWERKTVAGYYGRYPNYQYKPVVRRMPKIVHKRGRFVYVKPVAVHRQPWRHRYQSERYNEPTLPALAMRLILQLTRQQMEMQRHAMARATSADINEQIVWNDNGKHGTVRVTREGIDSEGRACREFQQTIEIGDNYETGYGIACRNRNGDWEMLP